MEDPISARFAWDFGNNFSILTQTHGHTRISSKYTANGCKCTVSGEICGGGSNAWMVAQ